MATDSNETQAVTPRRRTSAEKRVAADRRHTALVVAMQEAISTLKEPFSENDEMPGTIEDAIAILRNALSGRGGGDDV